MPNEYNIHSMFDWGSIISKRYAPYWDKINKCAEHYFSLSEKDGAARKSRAMEALAESMYLPFSKSLANVENSALTDSDDGKLMSGINEFFLSDLERYDKSKNDTFSKYFYDILRKRLINVEIKDSGAKKIGGKYSTPVSLNAPLSDDSGSSDESETEIGDTVSDQNDDIDAYASYSGVIVPLVSACIDIRSHLSGKEANGPRLNYYKVFFTDTFSRIARNVSDSAEHLKYRERELFNNVKKLFLDYTLINECRTVDEVSKSELKRWCDMIDEESMDRRSKAGYESRATDPLPNSVFIAYMQRAEGVTYKTKNSANATVSSYKNDYDGFIKSVIRKQ